MAIFKKVIFLIFIIKRPLNCLLMQCTILGKGEVIIMSQ